VARPPRPSMDQDSAFFWEGVEKHELRIQRCAACGTLRHPPRPMCSGCHALEWDHVVARGSGQIYSFVVHHHPPVHGFETPFAIAVIELDEGTRLVGNVIDSDPDEVSVGMPVEVAYQSIEGEWTLPQWRRRPQAGRQE